VDSEHAHSWDLVLWHAVCGAAMLAMLLVALPSWAVTAGPAVFGIGVAWAALHVVRRERSAVYARVGLCCAAMLVMLVPGWSTTRHATGSMSGMAMPGTMATGPSLLALASALVMVGVAFVGLRRLLLPDLRPRSRAAALGESAVAVAMAAMLAGAFSS
jgi:hypothetical protein